MSILYEVNITLQPEIVEKYTQWLKGHIEEILHIEGFTKAEVYQEESPTRLTVHYHVKSQKYLEDYFQKQAPRLRQDAIDRFGNAFTVNRRVLTLKRA